MSNTNLSFVLTADGSKTLFNESIGENYHSLNGAHQESQHVFVSNGLDYFFNQHKSKEISVLEIGFGTGLNFLLSADYAISNNINLNYVGVEASPLSPEIIGNTAYQDYLRNEELWKEFNNSYPRSFNKKENCTENIQLQLANQTLANFFTETRFDIIYFDAFARNYQPEMWTTESITKACMFLKDKGIFVTYSVTGDLKRALKSLGFQIERPAGAAGKREMMRALLNKNDAL